MFLQFPEEIGGHGTDFVDTSHSGLCTMLTMTDRWIGDEMYNVTADILNIDIYVLSRDSTGKIFCNTTHNAADPRNSIIIYGSISDKHYSTVVYADSNGCDLVFSPSNPIIVKLKEISGTIPNYVISKSSIMEIIRQHFDSKRIPAATIDSVNKRDLLSPYLKEYNASISR